MKKILALICSLALVLSTMTGVVAKATATGCTMTVGSVSGAAGETVEVEVILENNPGISSAVLEIDYDKTRLTLTSATIGEKFSAGAFTNVNLPYVTFVRSGDVVEDDVLLTLSFTINSEATTGDAYVTILYEEGDITNYDEDDVNFEVVPGKVVVECPHTSKTEVPSKSADCVNSGNNLYFVCDSCGLAFKADGVTETTVEAETIVPLGHDLTDADCTEAAKCQREGCGYVEGSSLGHSFTHYVPNNDANCTEDGTKTAQCDRCDVTDTITDVGSAKGHDFADATCTAPKTCKVCGTTEGDPMDHNFTNYVSNNDATCTKDGTKTAKCDRCDVTDTITDVGSAKGHDYADATCTAPKTCKVCGATEGDPLGHRFTNYVSNNDATCTEDGTKTAKCDHCDVTDTITDVGSAKGHDYADATCTASKTCKVCGATEGDPLDHSYATTWSKGEDGHWHECSACGDKIDFAAHNYGDGDKCIVCEYERAHIHRLNLVPAVEATCTTDGNVAYYTCSGCENWFEDASGSIVISDKSSVVIAALGHDMTDATCTEAPYCKREGCEYTEGSALGHSFTNYVSNNDATCTEDGTKTAKCDRCDVTDTITVVGSAKGHDYADATCTAPKTCKVCGVTEGDPLGHSYATTWSKGEDGHWHECSACGDKTDFSAHDYGTTGDICMVCEYERTHIHELTLVPSVDATCTEGGNKAYYTCSGCENWFEDAVGSIVISEKSSVVVAALGHDMAEATCTEAAYCQRKDCDHTEGAALGHVDENADNKCDRCGASMGGGQPTTPDKPTDDVPQTGDISQSMMWAVVLMLSIAGTIICVLFSKKKNVA